ncbi:MAG: diaminopimelate decarboxylase [Betaproteobacteria bacterium]|nr:diaminopimelate decarboxylase [Betaproteobacteria bacterium]
MTSIEQLAAAGEIDGVALAEIAEQHGTPCYVYSARQLRSAASAVQAAIAALPDSQASYAVKANGNLALLRIIAEAGLGFDVGSAGELARVAAATAGLNPKPHLCMTGPCKSAADIAAALGEPAATIICESPDELTRVAEMAGAAGKTADIGVRVNPDVDAATHRHIATGIAGGKFGVDADTGLAMMEKAGSDPRLRAAVLHCHIGSQIARAQPLIEAAGAMIKLRDRLSGEAGECRIDLGGGFGIGDARQRPSEDVLAALADWLADNAHGIGFSFQPGRSIVARAGLLLARVEYIKGNHILIDAAMNDLLRPALYEAQHPVAIVGGKLAGTSGSMNIAGPVCESADFLARDIDLAAKPGDLLAIGDAGAYGFVMASNYNGRPRPCELLIDAGKVAVIRSRETIADLLAADKIKSDG